MNTRSKRPAFTLVELLVVMALILILGSLSVMFIPRMSEQQRAARGATQLQQWLITAQSQALRDQAPRGLRIFLDTNGEYGIEAQFIMQPDDFREGAINPVSSPGNTLRIVNSGISNGTTDQSLWSVQVDDYVEVMGGPVHRITSITESTPGQYTLDVFQPLAVAPAQQSYAFPHSFLATNDYRIIRQPRISSDEVLKLPDDIVVDFTTKSTVDTQFAFNQISGVNESVDILFSPSGAVMGKQMGEPSLVLWVRDVTMNLDEGEPTLIAVYTRTGAIAAHPVDISGYVTGSVPPFPTPADPYKFTRDGRSSGN